MLKKLVTVLCLAVLCLGLATVAEGATLSGTCGDNLTWTLSSDGELKISGTGTMPDYSADNPAPWLAQKENIATIVLECGVTDIGNYAFANLNIHSWDGTGFTGKIGDYAFYGTTYRSEEKISTSSGTSTAVGTGNTKVGPMGPVDDEAASSGASNGKPELILSTNVTSVGKYAFANSTLIGELEIEGEDDCSLTIGEAAFSGCTDLETVEIYGRVTGLAKGLFNGCTFLKKIIISNTVTTIGENAFSGCTALKDVYYLDVEDEWKKVEGNEQLKADTIHCIVYSGSCGENVTWELKDGVLTISGSGAMADYTSESAPWYFITSEITSVVIENGVTGIGKNAFSWCSKMTSISIPDTVTSIGSYAFRNCRTLTAVIVPNGVTSIGKFTFKNCYSLASITIPDGVTSIGYAAFYRCSNLESITIPGSVMEIEEYAFDGCTALNDTTYTGTWTKWAGVTVGEYNTQLTSNIFCTGCGENLEWGISEDGVLTITGTGAMENFTAEKCAPWNSVKGSIKSVVIDKGATTIGDYAFSGCSSLASVTIPASVTAIGESTFSGCTGLTSISIPKTVTFIGTSAFSGCTGLTSVYYPGAEAEWNTITGDNTVLPTSVTVTYSTFAGGTCGEGLKWSISSTGELKISGTGAMSDYTEEAPAPWLAQKDNIATIVLEDGVTDIGNYSFANLNIHSWDGTRFSGKIGDYAFYGTTYRSEGKIGASTAVGTGNTEISPMRPVDDEAASSGASNGKPELILSSNVTSVGKYAFANSTLIGELEIEGEDGYSLTVGESAFSGCTDLEAVDIYGGATEFAKGLFEGCTGLETVEIHGGVTEFAKGLFNGCTSLKKIIIPNTVTSIGESAFSGCTALTDVYYLDVEDEWKKVTIAEDNEPLKAAEIHCIVYSGSCGDNVTWKLEDGILTISGSGAMADYTSESVPWDFISGKINSVVIEDGVTGIGKNAFSWCSKMTSISIPDTVTSIGSYAFRDCRTLTSVIIPNGVKSIGKFTFKNCYSLASITIPDGVTSIGYAAFYSCIGLESITIPESVTEIGEFAFDGCTALNDASYTGTWTKWNNNVTIGKYNTPLEGNIFCTGCGENLEWTISKDGVLTITGTGAMENFASASLVPWNEDTESIKSVVIANGVTTIGDYAFSGCSSLASITIPASVTAIGESTFSGCTGLTSITIPETVTAISNNAFENCTGLTSISIPKTVTSIGTSAFSGCTGLTSVYYPGTETEWNTITGGNTVLPTSITVTYSTFAGGTCGEGLKWSISSTGELKISGTGAMSDYTEEAPAPWLAQKDNIATIVLESEVTDIGNYAFANLNIHSWDGTRFSGKIGDYAFYGTTYRSEEKIGASTAVGTGNTKLIGGPVDDEAASSGASNGKPGLILSSNVTSVGKYAFANSTLIGELEIEGEDDYSLTIGEAAFSGCTDLETVAIYGSITEFAKDLFKGCTFLKKIIISNTVTTIGENAFSGCTALTDVYYLDVVDVWNKVDIADDNEPLTEAEIHCIVYSGSCGENVTWELEDGVLTISGSGAMANYTSESVPWYFISGKIKSVVINKGVTTVGNYAFRSCRNILSATIPESVTTIGKFAFYNCDKLTSLTISEGVTAIGKYAFDCCTALIDATYTGTWTKWSNVTVEEYNTALMNNIFCTGCGENLEWAISEDGVLTITGTGAMENFTAEKCAPWNSVKGNIKSVAIDKGVTTIGDYAFADCSSLASVTIPVSVTAIGDHAFDGCAALNDVTYTGIWAKWAGVTVGECNIALKDNIFCIGCGENLEWTISKDGVLTITGTGAMENFASASLVPWNEDTESINSVIIANGVTTIGDYAFSGCSSLASITIPASVTAIGEYAIDGCTALADVYYSGTQSSWEEISGIGSSALPDNVVVHCSDMTFGTCGQDVMWTVSVSVSGVLTIFGSGDMYDFSAAGAPWEKADIDIESVIIEDGVTSIGAYAFYTYHAGADSGAYSISTTADTAVVADSNCKSMKAITIADSVKRIGAHAFEGCTKLEGVDIPDSVTSIGESAFKNCTTLTTVIIPNEVTSIGSSAFYGCSSLESVTIPESVTEIGEDAFGDCQSLKTVNYSGTQSEWNKINKGSSNDSLSNTVTCVSVAEKIKNIFECLIGNASFSGTAAEERAEVNGIEGFDVGDVQAYYIESRSQTDTGTTE